MSDKAEVTQDDAVRWMENAMRNWPHVPRLSRADVEEVRVALQRFAEKSVNDARQASTDPLMREVREGLRLIRDMCPVTCDMSVAHEMAATADALLAKIEEPKG